MVNSITTFPGESNDSFWNVWISAVFSWMMTHVLLLKPVPKSLTKLPSAKCPNDLQLGIIHWVDLELLLLKKKRKKGRKKERKKKETYFFTANFVTFLTKLWFKMKKLTLPDVWEKWEVQ